MTAIQVTWETWSKSGRVGAHAELLDVRTQSASANLRELGAQPPFAAELEVTCGLQRQAGEPFAVVSAEYSVVAKGFGPDQDQESPEENPTTVVADFKCTLLALYSFSDLPDEPQISEEEWDAFANSTGLMTVHPYARELIHDQTLRMGLPGLTIGIAQIAK